MRARIGEGNRDEEFGEWAEDVERRPGHAGSIVFSVRFGRPEIAQVRRAAARAGERTSEFIRVAALQRARGAAGIYVDLVPSTSPTPGGAILFARPGPKTEVASSAEFVAA